MRRSFRSIMDELALKEVTPALEGGTVLRRNYGAGIWTLETMFE